jgi:alpha-glucosidase
MPYIYTCAYEAAVKGLPLERSLHLEFPEDASISPNSVHSLFGPSLLKVLITEKGKQNTTVYLPKDLWWYDQDGNAWNGGTEVSVSYPPGGEIRWFAKEGAVIPTAEGCTHLQDALFEHVVLLVFPIKTATKQISSTYFEDDGVSELHTGRYTVWEYCVTEGQLTITKAKGGAPSKKNRIVTVRIAGGQTFSFDPDTFEAGASRSYAIEG